MKASLTTEDVIWILEAPGAREFIQRMQKIRKMSFAQIARKGGFSSRAHVRELIHGPRGFTQLSISRIVRAFSLNADWRDFFLTLVALSARNTTLVNWSEERLKRRLQLLRHRLNRTQKRIDRSGETKLVEQLLAIPHFLPIYASLGNTSDGATLTEIQERTNLNDSTLQNSLQKMKSTGVVTLSSTTPVRYFAREYHLSFSEVVRSEHFRHTYLKGLEHVKDRATQDFNANNLLFIQSVFCVRSTDLPDLKKRLGDLLTEFADRAIDDEKGDRIATLLAALV